ncbi:hypothetical protein CERSUDRAFT_108541 [Gelatoporia subvermispora B]|uniref:Uncharacterized protein n=1 Tax=Ceriporiopsis subvermispora (strain B) TaxID=914234 RepID=M2R359_CERS8|nr:hypothetical protein CERSUDRAFT_108541 [Gelatoporia subvermispora B]
MARHSESYSRRYSGRPTEYPTSWRTCSESRYSIVYECIVKCSRSAGPRFSHRTHVQHERVLVLREGARTRCSIPEHRQQLRRRIRRCRGARMRPGDCGSRGRTDHSSQ